jgi:hypothetical protein
MAEFLIMSEQERVQALNALRAQELGRHGLYLRYRDGKRTDAQNRTMWKMLSPWAGGQELYGKKWDKESWKCVFMNALGKQSPMLPQLDEQGFFPMGYRSSQMGVKEMGELLEFIIAESAQRGISFPWLTEEMV